MKQACCRPVLVARMIRRLLSLSMTLVVASVLAGAADSSSFAGKWQMDKKETTAVGAPEELEQDIDLDGPKMVIRSKYTEPKNAIYPLMWVGIMTYELPLSTDGTERENQIGPFKHVSKTVVDGKKMTTDFTAT